MGLREAEPGSTAGWAGTAGVATAAMAASMLALYAVSALGPALAQDLQLPRSAVGALVTATFSVACVASLVVGGVVDVSGPRRGLLWLAAGLALPPLAAVAGWRVGVAAAAVLPRSC